MQNPNPSLIPSLAFQPTSSRGFTLIETMVVVLVLAILAALAVPSLRSAGDRILLNNFSASVVSDMRLARGESIRRGHRVVLCKSADGSRCSTAGGWEQGWIVFDDLDNDGVRDAAEALLHRGAALPRGWKLMGNQAIARFVSYHPTGTTRLLSGAFQAGTFTLCRETNGTTEARQLVLNAAGRPRISTVTVKECA